MARPEPRDQLAIVLTCEAELLPEMTHFYVDAVGFEEERRWVDAAGQLSWVDLRDGALRLKLAKVAALSSMPSKPTQGASLLVEVRDVEGRSRAIARRAPDIVMKTEALGGAHACVMEDPAGNTLWLIRYSAESPDRIGDLTPAGE